MTDAADYLREADRRVLESTEAAMAASVKALRLEGALRALMYYAPGGHSCLEFNHAKADQHLPGEACKPQERWRDALENARQALRDCYGV